MTTSRTLPLARPTAPPAGLPAGLPPALPAALPGALPSATQGGPAGALPSVAPLLSAQWFRVATLRPLLPPRLASQRHVQRGQVWHVLTLADGTRSFRLNAVAWHTVARCDGRRTTQELWDFALAEFGDAAPGQDELLSILARLHAAGLLSFDRRPDFGAANTTQLQTAEVPAARRNSLLAWRIPLGRPDAWLARLARPLAAVPGWPLLAAWLLATGWALLAGVAHAGELAAQLHELLGAPQTWGLAWLAYPALKLLHETAHGLVARRLGAQVSEWGITLLMFVPVPYVDASAASALPRRRQRLAVAAAGIVVEGGVAAAALAVLLNVQPGALHDTALLVFFIAALSTLLVNANPLLRFDGYHMLSDALNLPNLATRSSQYTLQALARVLLRSRAPASLVPAAGERPWLLAYAPAALAMRWLVAWAVVIWLGSIAQPLGLLAAAAFAWSLLVAPALKLLRWLHSGALDGPGGARAAPRLLLTGLLALPAALLLWPLPVSTVAQGILWLPEHALVRSQAAGVVGEVLVGDGQQVKAGDAVVQLVSPTLHTDVQRLHGRVQGLLAEQARALQAEPATAVQAEHTLQLGMAELARAEERLQQLTVRASVAGRIVIARAADLPGHYVQRGALLAHVITGEPGIVRLAVSHDSAAHIAALERAAPAASGATAGPEAAVQVQGADLASPPRLARWSGRPSGGVTQLPGAALGDRSGGRIATDATDSSGLRPAQPVLVGELQLEGEAANRIGERVLVRFEHGRSPLLLQLAGKVQQQLLRHFNPST
jgi:putative peptide zinc metalloprotease protein